MKMFKKVSDEREDLEFLRIEHTGFWVMFFGLIIVLHAQLFLDGFNISQIAGELIILLAGAVFVVIRCTRNGLWSRRAKPTVKSNLIFSLAGTFLVNFISLVLQYRYHPENGIVGILTLTSIISFGAVFAACFVLLTITSMITNRRRAKLESDFGEQKL